MSILKQVRKPHELPKQLGLKILVYGQAGAGKTSLIRTIPCPHEQIIVISAEGGLLSIADLDVDALEVRNLEQIQQIFKELRSGGHDYRWVCIDSISEIAEVVLAHEKTRNKDPRKAYGELADRLISLLKAFRDLPINVYITCKEARVDDDGKIFRQPGLPGSKLTQEIPYLLDTILHLGAVRSDAGTRRLLVTSPDDTRIAKDRSGQLDQVEEADLSVIVSKMMGGAAP